MSTIELKLFEAEDISELHSWIRSAPELHGWSGSYFVDPLTQLQIVTHLKKLTGPPQLGIPFKGLNADGEMVAYGEITKIRKGTTAQLRKIIVKPGATRRKGYGEAFVRGLLDIAFKEHHLHRVYLGVYNTNTNAVSLYLKCGFRNEGIWREHVKVGDEFWTLEWMGILRKEWDPISYDFSNIT